MDSVVLKLKLHLCLLVAQSHPTLFGPPLDCSPPGSSVHGILQARILEGVAIPFLRELPNPGIEPGSPALQADSLPTDLLGKPTSESNLTISIEVEDV